MKIAIDIDGVADRIPEFLSLVSKFLLQNNHHIIILTSRSNKKDVINHSLNELAEFGIKHSEYYFLPEIDSRLDFDPPKELNWFEKHIWQKAEYCQRNGVDIFFEDDEKTVDLVKRYSPNTVCLQVK